MARFTTSEVATLAPGHDLLTKTTVGPFVDTLTDVQFGQRGRIYLAVDTVRELALAAGLFDIDHDKVAADWQAAYDQGYREAVRDNFRDDLLRAAADLRDLVGVLTLAADAGVPEAGGDLGEGDVDGLLGVSTGTDGAAAPRRGGPGSRRKP